MSDTNVTEVKFRSNSQSTATWVNGKLHFQFRDNAVIAFNPALVSQANRARAELHGWEARLRDSMALGKGATPAEMKAALRRLIDHYQGGATEWSPATIRNTPPDAETVALALERVFGKPAGVGKAMIEALAGKREIAFDAAVAAWAEGDKVAKEILVIRAERRTSDAPAADDLLAEIEGLG